MWIKGWMARALGLLASVALVTAGADAVTQTATTVNVSLVAKNPRPTLHEPVVLVLKIENRTNQPVAFDLGLNRKANLQFTVTEPDGSVIRVPRLSSEGFGRIGRLTLDPGKSYEQELLLNEWYQLARPGSYRIRCALTAPVKVAGTAAGAPETNVVEVQAQPRSPEALAQASQRLLLVATTEPNAWVAAEAAAALSYVVDPAAVPYLKDLLEKGSPQVRQHAAYGLGRIANREAIDILASNLKTQDADLNAVVRNVLTGLLAKVTDPGLKQAIERALK
jgi:hypothetical protein